MNAILRIFVLLIFIGCCTVEYNCPTEADEFIEKHGELELIPVREGNNAFNK